MSGPWWDERKGPIQRIGRDYDLPKIDWRIVSEIMSSYTTGYASPRRFLPIEPRDVFRRTVERYEHDA